jgi:aryl-alcohol dehydrogenase-like predicted oxidoreductase
MKYKLLGRSGLRVSEICLGTMTFGEEWGWGNNKEISQQVFNGFAEAGGNFIDTANSYTNGTSEKMVGEFMGHERDKFVLATKYTITTNPKDPNAGGNHRKNLVQSVNASLKRLNCDYIDLLWIHMWDNHTPTDELMRALDDIVKQGKVLYVGASDTPAWVVAQANTMADMRGWNPFIGLQLEYSLVERSIEPEFFPMADSLDLGIAAWSPLAFGVLTGKYLGKQAQDARLSLVDDLWKTKYLNDKNQKIAQAVVNIAQETGKSPAQVALSWTRQKSPRVIPIIGAKSTQQLNDNLGCLNFELTYEQMRKLDEASAFSSPFPHNFLSRKEIQHIWAGDLFEQVEAHSHH